MATEPIETIHTTEVIEVVRSAPEVVEFVPAELEVVETSGEKTEVVESVQSPVEVVDVIRAEPEVIEYPGHKTPGPPGPQGKSAYQSYLDTTTDDPPKTEEQWVSSQTGPQGPAGKDGQIKYTGVGPPPQVIVGASPGDTYLDLGTGDVYKLV